MNIEWYKDLKLMQVEVTPWHWR